MQYLSPNVMIVQSKLLDYTFATNFKRIGRFESGKGLVMTESILGQIFHCHLLALYPQRNIIFQRVYFSQVRYIFETALRF